MIFYVLPQMDAVLRDGVIQPGFQALSAFVATPLRMGMVLLVAAHGFRLMKGHTQGLSSMDIGWLVLRMALVTELLINWGFFNTWIYDIVWDTYTRLADVMASTLPFTALSLNAATLDQAFMGQLSLALEDALSIPTSVTVGFYPIPIPFLGVIFEDLVRIPILLPDLMPNIAGFIRLVMTVILFSSVFVVMLLSRLGLTSCLAVAPIFIALALFQHTRSHAESWLRGMLGFILTPLLLVLVLVVASACIGLLDRGPPAGWPSPPAGLATLGQALACLLLYYALARSIASIPQFASGMVGSMLSHMGDGATHQSIGQIHRGVGAGIGAVKGAAVGVATSGFARARAVASSGARSATR